MRYPDIPMHRLCDHLVPVSMIDEYHWNVKLVACCTDRISAL